MFVSVDFDQLKTNEQHYQSLFPDLQHKVLSKPRIPKPKEAGMLFTLYGAR